MPRPSLSKSWKRLTSKLGAEKDASIYTRRLDWTKQEIRLIKILPEANPPSNIGPSCIEIELHYVSLEDAPKYTALSYAWGDPNVTKLALVDGKAFQVTINLEAGLREIRSEQESNKESSPTLYWIDALCIDQNNDVEKAEQVQNMATIFRQAIEVLIWLGESDSDTSMIFSELKVFASVAQAAGIDVDDYDSVEENKHKVAGIIQSSQLFQAENWRALKKFLSRNWWERTWVIQEIAFATSACMACGSERIDWSNMISFMTVVLFFMILPSPSSATAIAEHKETMSKVLGIYRKVGNFLSTSEVISESLENILMLLQFYAASDRLIATDPRDHIYSRLAFMQESDRAQITVRYDSQWSCRQLYAEVTELIMRQSGLSILQYAEPEFNLAELDLPSWVLNFAKQDTTLIVRFNSDSSFHACGVTALEDFNFHVDASRNVLHLKGLEIDSIAVIGQVFTHHDFGITDSHDLDTQEEAIQHIEELHAWINNIRRMLSVTSCFYKTSDSDLINSDLTEEAIFRTCVMGCNGEPISAEIRESYRKLIGEIEPPEDFKDDSWKWKLEASTLFIDHNCIRGRTPFMTSQGYLGLARGPVSSGDHVHILQGAKTPFVFHCKDDGQLELKSDAYVDGVMFGEIFDNQLSPKEWIPLEVC
jgi:hypothetical protein